MNPMPEKIAVEVVSPVYLLRLPTMTLSDQSSRGAHEAQTATRAEFAGRFSGDLCNCADQETVHEQKGLILDS